MNKFVHTNAMSYSTAVLSYDRYSRISSPTPVLYDNVKGSVLLQTQENRMLSGEPVREAPEIYNEKQPTAGS